MASTLRVNPTRMELTRIKRRLVTARRGHKLLKDKRDEMVRQFILLVRENRALRQEVERELSAALNSFALARSVTEPELMEEALLYPARNIAIDMTTRSILSVRVPSIRVREETMRETTLSYGLAETSAQLDGAFAQADSAGGGRKIVRPARRRNRKDAAARERVGICDDSPV